MASSGEYLIKKWLPERNWYRLIADGKYNEKYLCSIRELRKKGYKHIIVLGGKYKRLIGEQLKKGQRYV